MANAETDEIFPAERRHATEAILAKNKAVYESKLYGGTVHGFAVRGDLSDPRVKYAKEAAFAQATLWFDEHLKA